ncbi:MAG TPA: Maf family protein [Pseudomonadales bacterium]|nr:Maf family protein [Pseudomonadales bacterium]
MNTSSPSLFLASASPRRAALLQQIGIHFHIFAVDIDERWLPGENLMDYVTRLAEAKAHAAQQTLPTGSVILAADTAGSCHGRPLVKPAHEEDAVAMLVAMSGKAHTVSTAISVCCGERMETSVIHTEVFFRQISEQEARRYWATSEPADKAGSYAIQGFGAVFVERIDGSYSNVVGLPLYETAAILEKFGIHCWQEDGNG